MLHCIPGSHQRALVPILINVSSACGSTIETQDKPNRQPTSEGPLVYIRDRTAFPSASAQLRSGDAAATHDPRLQSPSSAAAAIVTSCSSAVAHSGEAGGG